MNFARVCFLVAFLFAGGAFAADAPSAFKRITIDGSFTDWERAMNANENLIGRADIDAGEQILDRLTLPADGCLGFGSLMGHRRGNPTTATDAAVFSYLAVRLGAVGPRQREQSGACDGRTLCNDGRRCHAGGALHVPLRQTRSSVIAIGS